MNIVITADFSAVKEQIAGMAARAKAPCAGASGEAMLDIMRHGEGSIAEQFASTTEYTLSGSNPWPQTLAFGALEPPSSTLHRSGDLMGAWTGEAGSISEVTDNRVETGVSGAAFPDAHVFQSETPTKIVPTARNIRGGLAMQSFLGLNFNVWLTAERLLQGLVIMPRRVGIGSVMYNRLVSHVENWIVNGRVGATT